MNTFCIDEVFLIKCYEGKCFRVQWRQEVLSFRYGRTKFIWVWIANKVHGANMGPTWVLSAPDGPHVGPMSLAIRECFHLWICQWDGQGAGFKDLSAMVEGSGGGEWGRGWWLGTDTTIYINDDAILVTNSLWAHNPNLLKIHITLTWKTTRHLPPQPSDKL